MIEERSDKKDKLQGEGDYESGRAYQRDATEFTKSHTAEKTAGKTEDDLSENRRINKDPNKDK